MIEVKTGDPISQSGLDMGQTIAWYDANKEILSQRLPSILETATFPTIDGNYFALSQGEIEAVINLFPAESIRRSRLQNNGSIIGKPSLYFAKDASPDHITTTGDIKEALSPTAIIPSYTDNARWKKSEPPTGDIWLFEIPESVDPQVRKIIIAEGLAHEFAHTLVTQLIYTEGYKLKLPDETIVDGFEYLLDFAKSAEKHPPISHYSSFYRKNGEEFKSNLAIDEELVETITAHLLGFVFCNDKDRRLNPLGDRPEIELMIEKFLHAELA